MKRTVSVLAFAGFLGVIVISGARPNRTTVASGQTIAAAYGRLPLVFEANHGQSDPQVKFLARGSGYTLFLTATETVLSVHPFAPVRITLLDSNSSARVEGVEELPGASHYFIGKDPEKWRRSVPHYDRVRYRNVYPGVDVVYYGNQHQIENDFLIAPGADPKQIRFRVTGADTVELDDQGDLLMRVSHREVRLRKPTIYQGEGEARHEIAGRYTLTANTEVGFELDSFDRKRPLVIDPVLAFSTYLGGSASESFGPAVFVDAVGDAYIAGPTTSPDFPLLNALQPNKGGQTSVNAFVAKLSADGKRLLYATYLGGSSGDARAIAVDRSGNVYVTGRANSADFPTTANAFQKSFGGGPADGWVAKLSPDGSKLLYCTYLGGSGTDNGNDLTVDSQGNAIVTGATNSTDFPTAAPVQPRSGGGFDVFATKLSASDNIIYSTYLGGSNEDRGNLISVDAQGNAYVSGRTASVDFPVANALQKTYGGGQYDAHMVKLSPEGRIVFSTYLGGNNADTGGKTAVDAGGNILFTGTTNSTDFPVVRPLQANLGGGSCGSPARACYDAFVARLTADGSGLLYSSYLGGNGEENGVDGWGAIGVDAAGFAYVAGRTASSDFPLTNALQPKYGGGPFDNFVTKLSPDNAAIIYSTYLGGSGDDGVYDLKVQSAGNVFISGFTGSLDFPTANPLQPAYNGGTVDAFVTKVAEVLASDVFHFAQAGGGGGFSTAIALTNPSTTRSASGSVSFFGSGGGPLGVVVANAVTPFAIPPSRTVIISSLEQGPLSSGYARVLSTEPVFANATYALPGLPHLSVAPSSTGSVFRASISRSAGTEHGIALVNLSTTTAFVNVLLTDADGRWSLSTMVRLAPGEQLNRFLSELMPELPDEFAATLQIAGPPGPFAPSPTLAGVVIEFAPRRLNAVSLTVIR